MITDQNANVVARHDYLPFGEELTNGQAGRNAQFGPIDGVNQKFTGQMRDSETQLDYFNARYFGGALGRFTSPDPANAGADLTDPQTWNAYAYVRNNPLAFTDPTGTDICPDGNWASVCVTASNPPWWYFMNGLGSWYLTWFYSGQNNNSSSGAGGGGTTAQPQQPQQQP